ncbi:helix-turn-helix domain-containing protein [Serratia marcescens]|uniref:helix-turn-helix domain-containing protein n=1 Tax=Serratia marcescens TaxID=615 RepID=UPI0009B55D62|nr:LuxR C-terminal-related transcriptional regulator [Serratia marcescens]
MKSISMLRDFSYYGFPCKKKTVPKNHLRVPPCITIVDPCTFSGVGLFEILAQSSLFSLSVEKVRVFKDVAMAIRTMRSEVTFSSVWPGAVHCMVVCLPQEPIWGISQLLQLDAAKLMQAGYHRLVVISPFDINNGIRRVLVGCGLTIPVRIIQAHCSIEKMCRVLLGQGTLLEYGKDEYLPIMPARELSKPEREVLSRTLQGITINQLAKQRYRSPKTLYAQRTRALNKLQVSNVSFLLGWFK